MRYKNLEDLLAGSLSTRRLFLTLPVSLQMELHGKSEFIRTAAELRFYLNALEKQKRYAEISEMLF